MVVKQITEDGRIVNEKDWRRENIEIERKTKEREDEKKRKQQKEIESKNNRIEILQKIRQEEKDRKKVEERRRLERGIKDSLFSYKQNELVEKVFKYFFIFPYQIRTLSLKIRSQEPEFCLVQG